MENKPLNMVEMPEADTLFFEDIPVESTAETSDGKTVGILLKDGRSLNVPKWEADLLLKPNPISHSDSVNLRANYVAGKTLDLWLELNIRFAEMDVYYKKIAWSYYDKHGGSLEAAINKTICAFTNGLVENQDQLRTGHVDAILRAIPKNDLTPPNGDATVKSSA
jgi:hypothetical protein